VQDKHVGIENIQEDSNSLGGDSELRDWHNWTQIQLEAQRVGPGEQVGWGRRSSNFLRMKGTVDEKKVEPKAYHTPRLGTL
jgi:hypothetical protein